MHILVRFKGKANSGAKAGYVQVMHSFIQAESPERFTQVALPNNLNDSSAEP